MKKISIMFDRSKSASTLATSKYVKSKRYERLSRQSQRQDDEKNTLLVTTFKFHPNKTLRESQKLMKLNNYIPTDRRRTSMRSQSANTSHSKNASKNKRISKVDNNFLNIPINFKNEYYVKKEKEKLKDYK